MQQRMRYVAARGGFVPVESGTTDADKWRCPLCWKVINKNGKGTHRNSFNCLAHYYTGPREGRSDA